MDKLHILKTLLLQEEEEKEKDRMETPPKTFEDDPMNFILNKYDTLNEQLTYLLGDNFKEYLTGIYVIADKPTSFKIVLHNNQYFFMTFMGEAYQANVSGKNYFLLNTGEKQRAMMAITRLLRWGNPLKTKGAEGAEQAATETGETGVETPPAESSETGGEETGEETETLEESKNMKQTDILKSLLEVKVSGQAAETLAVTLWNASLEYENVPPKLSKFKSVFKELQTYSQQYNTKIEKYSGRKDPTTDFWLNETGKDKDEPKTDLLSLNKKLKLSAKKGPAQLMSAVQQESKATVLAAANTVGLDKKIKKSILDALSQMAVNTKTDKLNTAELRKSDPKKLKSEINKNAKKILDAATTANVKLQQELNKAFTANPSFKKAFVYEAMTGEQKFGTKSPAEANCVIAFNNDFTQVKIEDISKLSSPMVAKVADLTKLVVGFKSVSYKKKGEKAGYTFFSSVRLILKDLVEKQESLDEVLNSNQINEIDILDKIKQFFSYLYEKFNKLIDFISEGIKKIEKLLEEGIEKVLDFLGYEMEVDLTCTQDDYFQIM
jgi:hypothetical protein